MAQLDSLFRMLLFLSVALSTTVALSPNEEAASISLNAVNNETTSGVSNEEPSLRKTAESSRITASGIHGSSETETILSQLQGEESADSSPGAQDGRQSDTPPSNFLQNLRSKRSNRPTTALTPQKTALRNGRESESHNNDSNDRDRIGNWEDLTKDEEEESVVRHPEVGLDASQKKKATELVAPDLEDGSTVQRLVEEGRPDDTLPQEGSAAWLDTPFGAALPRGAEASDGQTDESTLSDSEKNGELQSTVEPTYGMSQQ
eukprot:GHVQ01015117.1.p2 GENE.GHVQ01015117.1~~GHVQ01015117.1.p2  ORF type:complete len:261 (-),score=48.52 GHVQ01015117.1:1756-2538(-)